MTDSESTTASLRAAAAISGMLGDVYDHVARLQFAVAAAGDDGTGQLSSSRLGDVQNVVAALVESLPWVGGGGFVAALDTVDDSHRFWDWWTRGAAGARVERLHPPRSSTGGAEYAYESMRWFRDGQSGRPCVFGPFVDFAGVNQLVILCSEPVQIDGRFCGIVGADLMVDHFEIELVRRLREVPGAAVVVGSSGRVIASTLARAVPGERFDGTGWRSVPVDAGRAEWTLYCDEGVS